MVECPHQRQPMQRLQHQHSPAAQGQARTSAPDREATAPPARVSVSQCPQRYGPIHLEIHCCTQFLQRGASADSSSGRRSKSQTPRGPVIGIFPAPIPADNVKRIPPEASGSERSNIHEIDGPEPDVRAIPARTGLSQAAFARSIGVARGTLVNWEQRRRRPEGPVRVLLALIDKDPTIVQHTPRR